MRLMVSFNEWHLLWEVWSRDFNYGPKHITVLQLSWNVPKWQRAWRVTWDGEYEQLSVYREINNKCEGWYLQGPLRRME